MDVLERIEKGEVTVIAFQNWVDGSGAKQRELNKAMKQDSLDVAELLKYATTGKSATTPRPEEEYHEDMGDVIWWKFPICEPPYVGSSLDCDWIDDYYTHWTPLAIPDDPEEARTNG